MSIQRPFTLSTTESDKRRFSPNDSTLLADSSDSLPAAVGKELKERLDQATDDDRRTSIDSYRKRIYPEKTLCQQVDKMVKCMSLKRTVANYKRSILLTFLEGEQSMNWAVGCLRGLPRSEFEDLVDEAIRTYPNSQYIPILNQIRARLYGSG